MVEHRIGNASAGDVNIAAAKVIDPSVGAIHPQYGILR
jgi:hypothetical protein